VLKEVRSALVFAHGAAWPTARSLHPHAGDLGPRGREHKHSLSSEQEIEVVVRLADGQSESVAGFVVRRLLWTIPILWLVITIVFFMMRSIGGDPFRHGRLVGLSNVGWVKYGDYQPPAIRQNQREKYGLDLPWYQQYGNYLKGVATLDFGPSLSFKNLRVWDIIREVAPRSLELTLLAFAWAVLFGIPIGILAALRPGSGFDYGARLFTTLGISLPSFFVATLLIYYLSVKLGVLPTTGWLDSWKSKILPSFTLSLVPMAYFARLLRASMLETLEADYVRMARAKGLSATRVVGVHALKNSLIPLVTVAGPMFGTMVTGAFIIENIFAVPGIARYYVASVMARDYTVVMGVTVVLATAIVVLNLLVDLAHHALDPRLHDA
jgi:ABC-type dipeptide/oligopeptide/nickel transport system permease component